MAHAPIGLDTCAVRILDQDNEMRPPRTTRAGCEIPDALTASGLVTDEDMVITRDPISGDWVVEDYAGEAVLFVLPWDCALDEVRRAATIYTAAFKAGFGQGRSVARSTGVLG